MRWSEQRPTLHGNLAVHRCPQRRAEPQHTIVRGACVKAHFGPCKTARHGRHRGCGTLSSPRPAPGSPPGCLAKPSARSSDGAPEGRSARPATWAAPRPGSARAAACQRPRWRPSARSSAAQQGQGRPRRPGRRRPARGPGSPRAHRRPPGRPGAGRRLRSQASSARRAPPPPPGSPPASASRGCWRAARGRPPAPAGCGCAGRRRPTATPAATCAQAAAARHARCAALRAQDNAPYSTITLSRAWRLPA